MVLHGILFFTFLSFIIYVVSSPVRDNILVNDRWGSETYCKHGDVKDCTDKYNPGMNVLSLRFQLG